MVERAGERSGADGAAGGSEFSFATELWEWDGPQCWIFASLPTDLADVVEELYGQHTKGFRSLRVEAVLGGHTWRTSIFPDKARATYLLPVKKEVRRRAGVEAGDVVEVSLSVL